MKNVVFLIGRITKDIELRATKNGINTANINIAVNREFKNNEGVYETDFINVTTYKHIAEMVSEYCKKGDLIGIQGRIQMRIYEKEDKKVYIQEIIADKVSFLASTNKSKEIEEKPKTETQVIKEAVNDPFEEFENEVQLTDDDLPF